jgi:hypothetical protein
LSSELRSIISITRSSLNVELLLHDRRRRYRSIFWLPLSRTRELKPTLPLFFGRSAQKEARRPIIANLLSSVRVRYKKKNKPNLQY